MKNVLSRLVNLGLNLILTEAAKEQLRPVGEALASGKLQNLSFIVEGHTDDNPINSDKFPSNWELSSHRASAVLRLFEENGFEKKHLRAIGFADTLPVLPNRDDNNLAISENQSQNRRIVLKLVRATIK